MYNRLFTKILDSSIWLEPCTTRIVWVTLIAAMDEEGYAHFSAIENLAARARVSVKDTQKAIDCFLAPDPNSANPENEGRRIERVPGGFFILNAPEHRKIMNRVIQKEQTRIRVAKHRAKEVCNAPTVTQALQSVTPASASVSSSEVEKGKKNVQGKATQEEVEAFCESIGLPRLDGEACFNKWEGNGWTNKGKAIRNWKATIRSWKIERYLPSQKANGSGQNGTTDSVWALEKRIEAAKAEIATIKADPAQRVDDPSKQFPPLTPEADSKVRELQGSIAQWKARITHAD